MLPLSMAFEGKAPWSSSHIDPDSGTVTVDFVLGWKVTALVLMCVVWEWAVISTASFTETIVLALVLQMSLFLGDFG